MLETVYVEEISSNYHLKQFLMTCSSHSEGCRVCVTIIFLSTNRRIFLNIQYAYSKEITFSYAYP